MAYKLVVSFNNNEEVMVWPSVPPDFGPEVEQRNGTYEASPGTSTPWAHGAVDHPLSGFSRWAEICLMPAEADTDGWNM